MKSTELTLFVEEFSSVSFADHRYSSFDYCYNYFRDSSGEDLQHDLEKSCAVLGFYLASWGMLRGSSFLLQKSYRYFVPLIKYISEVPKETWSITPDMFLSEVTRSEVLGIYKKISDLVIEDHNQEKVLITKILLGVFGIVPAYDTYFCRAFKTIDPYESKFSTSGSDSLVVIGNFFQNNSEEIKFLSAANKTKDFITEVEKYNYPFAKIIDMYGFVKGTKI